MAKGPIITDAVKNLIVKVYLEHPEWRAKEIQRKVNDTLREHNPRMNDDWPGLSTVQKVLALIHNKEKDMPPDPKDTPWRILDIAQYPIPPETLPIVLEAWASQLEEDPLTIREVLWIARLYYVFKEKRFNVDLIQLLIAYAKGYAVDEMVYQLTGKHPDKPEDLWGSWIFDAGLYSTVTGKDELREKAVKERENRSLHTPPETRKQVLKRTYREVQNERTHSQEVQE